MNEDGFARAQKEPGNAGKEWSLEPVDPLTLIRDLGVPEIDRVAEEMSVPREIDREANRSRACEGERRGKAASPVADEQRDEKHRRGERMRRAHEHAGA